MKRLLLIFIFLLLVPLRVIAIDDESVVGSTPKDLTPQVDAKMKVHDFADLFSEEQIEDLNKQAQSFIEKHNMDIVILTVEENNKADTLNYAMDFYDYNDFGKNKTHDGLLLIIDMDNRIFNIITTGYAILVFDDNRIDKILDSLFTNIKEENYYDGALTFIKKSSSTAALGVAPSMKNYKLDETGTPIKIKKVNMGLSILIAGIVSSIVIFVTLSSYKGIVLATKAGIYLTGTKNTITRDTFYTTHMSKVPISTSSSNGGSSTSRGSSGTSHGSGSGRSF